jgi:hypothetical protein
MKFQRTSRSLLEVVTVSDLMGCLTPCIQTDDGEEASSCRDRQPQSVGGNIDVADAGADEVLPSICPVRIKCTYVSSRVADDKLVAPAHGCVYTRPIVEVERLASRTGRGGAQYSHCLI